jgi:ABC-type uncharacterized transport system substrate-binding protein
MRLQIKVLRTSTTREIDTATATFVRERPDALFVGNDAFLTSLVQLVHLPTRHAIPTTYSLRDFAEAGGLMSYGASLRDAYRQVGIYAGRVLKGAKPADLPVVQASKFELVINNSTARLFGITVPPTLLARADEVIEYRRVRGSPQRYVGRAASIRGSRLPLTRPLNQGRLDLAISGDAIQ